MSKFIRKLPSYEAITMLMNNAPVEPEHSNAWGNLTERKFVIDGKKYRAWFVVEEVEDF